MKIAIGSDHGGFKLKNEVVNHLASKGFEIVDYGPDTEDSIDYSDVGIPVSEAVARGDFDKAILICGTGIGMSVAANKVTGIRCALVHDCYTARLTTEHNNSNVLAMGARVVGTGLALEIVDAWLGAEFEGGRHERRIDKIADYENNRG